MMDFIGTGNRVSEEGLRAAAAEIGVEPAVIKAVAEIEAAGRGFNQDNSLKMLFEARVFDQRTGGRYRDSHPTISSATWNRSLYKAGIAEYARLREALALDEDAALNSASWGAFQIMGFNHGICGYASAADMVEDFKKGEDQHLDAVVRFIKARGLADELKHHDWAEFARKYNGPGYRQNQYDTRLAAAYARLMRGREAGALGPEPSGDSESESSEVRIEAGEWAAVQTALNLAGADPRLAVDGLWGPRTRAAVIAFQRRSGLVPDGIVGPLTRAALGLGQAVSKGNRIVVYGDSIGEGIAKAMGWIDLAIVGAGFGNGRLPAVHCIHDGDKVAVSITGANDPEMPADRFSGLLEARLDDIVKRSASIIVLIGSPEQFPDKNKAIQDIAARRSIAVVPHSKLKEDGVLAGDGIHARTILDYRVLGAEILDILAK